MAHPTCIHDARPDSSDLLRAHQALRLELRRLMATHEQWAELPAVLARMAHIRQALQGSGSQAPNCPYRCAA